MTNDSAGVRTCVLPAEGVWRVGAAADPYDSRPPLTADELNSPRAGNRFDSPLGNYSVVYFATQLEGCFGETLARYRPDPRIPATVQGEWSSQGFMLPGEVCADWRHRRLAVRVSVNDGACFLDAEALETRGVLAKRLAPLLSLFEVSDLDVAAVRSGDRRVTRHISYWAWSQVDDDGQPCYAGIRYISRLADWECWALFDRVPTQELERRSITRDLPELRRVAKLYGLTIY